MTRTERPAKHNPFGELIGLTFSTCENGYSECGLEVSPRLFNPNGVLHGGVVYSLADTGMGAALHSRLADGQICATIEIKIAYLRPVTSGTLTCKTRLIRAGNEIAVLESDVENEGRLVAKALGTFSIFEAGPRPAKPSETVPARAPSRSRPRKSTSGQQARSERFP